ncbi:MAG TPA: hypothetical protein VFY73_05080 [Ideonella sp.]|uniref:type IV pilus assembly protein FimV n=1 Tax=Ideonella sp. TaxID=1929293 RepID=UPI002E2EFE81|nr:hypothetical protein [Ideonella sp.]HEX5683390.1 hypothetical protein [Ideonella sp.]
MPPRATALILACATAALAIEAQAIGFGRLTTSAVLGQPLNLPIPLRLDPGERLEPECVSAEIVAGDTALHPDRIRVRLEPSGVSGAAWLARVTTLVPIDEPVLDIALTVGCDKRFSRRFVAFADPPSIGQARAGPIELDTVAAPASGAVSMVANEAGPAAEAPPRRARAAEPSAARKPARPAASASAQASPKSTQGAKRRAATLPPSQRAAAATHGGARLILESDGPRLKLDMEAPIFMPPPLAAGDGAASVPEVEANAATQAERLHLLEKALADLQRESQAGREAAGVLKARLAEAENRGRAVPWLVGLVLLAVGIAAWLALRSRRHHHHETSEVPAHWWSPVAEAEPVAPEESAHSSSAHVLEPPPSDLGGLDEHPREAADTAPLPAALAMERDLPAPGGPTSARSTGVVPALANFRPEPIHERTMVISAPPPFMRAEPAAVDAVAAREVSVEELLDLEQQADFFIALGQEEAAIDLLMAHLRGTGGLSPLPYTKLLEIYRRQGDRDAYERIRTRFNRRFNAYAPEWEDGPLSGRALEDYAEVVQHLQSLWREPLDAMAMLEAMLFRKDAAYELFDLPAYKDVLVLYALARDLWQQGGGRGAAVDVLLPLDDGAGPDAVQAKAEPVSSPADAPPFELTAFALPPQQGQVTPPPSSPAPSTSGSSAADTEPTLDPARRSLR